MSISLTKSEGSGFTLSWSYKGAEGVKGEIRIGSILAVEGDQKLGHSTGIVISTSEGSSPIEMVAQ